MKNRCVICHITLLDESPTCEKRTCLTQHQLGEIPGLYDLAGESLLPGNAGRGSSSGEPTIGVNLAALEYRVGLDLLAVLHGWERIVREERNLNPTEGIRKHPDTAATVQAICEFLLAHFDWITGQDWFSEFGREISVQYGKGMAATGQIDSSARRATCPTTFMTEPTEPGGQPREELCGETLTMNPDMTILDTVRCRRCGTEWTTGRLMAVALHTEGAEIWVDAEAIGHHLGIGAHEVRKIARQRKLRAWHGLYNLIAIRKQDEQKGA